VFSAISSVGERYNYDCLEKIIDSTITELMAVVSPAMLRVLESIFRGDILWYPRGHGFTE
jgi:hypothetical protein